MKIGTFSKAATFAAVTTLASTATAGLAQQTIHFDVNNAALQVQNQAGQPSNFTGANFNGTVRLSYNPTFTRLAAIETQANPTSGFVNQTLNGTLSAFQLVINLTNGGVTGGTLTMTNQPLQGQGGSTDTVTANLISGGQLRPFVGGGWTIDSLLSSIVFSGNSFAGVNTSGFTGGGGQGNLNQGSLLAFRLQPNAQGTGFADVDIYVTNIPTPGTVALAGLASLAFAGRRRR